MVEGRTWRRHSLALTVDGEPLQQPCCDWVMFKYPLSLSRTVGLLKVVVRQSECLTHGLRDG